MARRKKHELNVTSMTPFADQYRDYLSSAEWDVKRQQVHARAGGMCERCRVAPMDECHHLTYEHKFNEPLEDLIGLCELCHHFLHRLSTFDPIEDLKDPTALVADRTKSWTTIPTGLMNLDNAIQGGLQRGSVTVVAGKPGSGKTAFFIQLCKHILANSAINILFVSGDMTAQMLVWRICAFPPKIGITTQYLDTHMSIDDAGSHTIAELEALVKRVTSKRVVHLLVVDNLQLITQDVVRTYGLEQVTAIIRVMKGLARQLDIAVVCASQLSTVDSKDGRPRMSQELAGIEQNSDVLLFVYHDRGVDDVIVAKNRFGPSPVSLNVTWDRSTLSFTAALSDDDCGEF